MKSSSAHGKPGKETKPANIKALDMNLLPVLNKIAELSVDKSNFDYLHSYKLTLDSTNKELVIKESKAFLASYSPSTIQPFSSFVESKLSELLLLQDNLNGLGSQLKQLSKQENTLLQERIKLNQTIEALATSSQRYQEICRTQQKKNKSTTEEVERMAREEIERTSKLRESCEESLRDVRASVEAEEHLLREKQAENEQLRVRINDFKSHLLQRKHQLEAYRKSKELQAQIELTKNQRFIQMKNHQDLQRKAYESNLMRQREKIKEVEEQIKLYSTKFIEFEEVWDETRSMFAAVENRCQDVAARAFAMEAQNQKLFSKAESRQEELEAVLNENSAINLEHRHLLAQCAEAEVECRRKQMERAELTKKLHQLRYPSEAEPILPIVNETIATATVTPSLATTNTTSSSSSSSSSNRRHRRMDPSSPAS